MSVDDRGRTVEHHFGYVRVIKPPRASAHEDFRAEGIRTVGLSLSNGIRLGFIARDSIYVPLDCRIVTIVKNQAQLDHVVDVLTRLEGGELCVTVSPD